MKKTHIGIILVAAIIFSGCIGPFSKCIMGSGQVIEQEYTLDEFSSIDFAGGGIVYVTQQPDQSLLIKAEDNVLEKLEVEVVNNKLKIYSHSCFTNIKPIEVHASLAQVNELAGSGSVKFIGTTPVETDTLDLKISGSGSFDLDLTANEVNTKISGSGKSNLRGTTTSHNVMVSGSADIKAFELATESTDLLFSGSGKAEVDASKELDVTVSGSARVSYTGDAAVTQTVSGSGKIEKV